MGGCSNLTVNEESEEIIYNATFSKTIYNYYETYTLGTDFNSVSVTLDWNNVGEAPEVEACANSSNAYRKLPNYLITMGVISLAYR
ncbi:unnamed protein product [Hymenolepis diminuta]|uniref:DUF5727 domain-containing protein n=1 Tax=Hymenolepis diminuta TaxID=6216 RepID=A0A564ZGD2_HYMDI|nr:unnamed protein product [Hymenolepis diminuta]